jgi:class 3 adenylate cyclase
VKTARQPGKDITETMGLSSTLLCWFMAVVFVTPAWARDLPIKGGEVDLTAWVQRADHEILELKGEWRFVPHQLVDPSDFPEQAEFRKVPATWEGENISYASYRLVIRLPPGEVYGFKTPGYTTSARIFINGRLVFEGGRVASLSDDEEASRQSRILLLEKSDTYDIVIQVANFIHARGGIFSAPLFGRYDDLLVDSNQRISSESFVVAGFFAIGLYHLIIFGIRKQKLVLFFAAACIVISVRISFSNAQVVRVFYDMSYWSSLRLEYISLYLINPLLETYLALMFNREYPWKIFRFRLLCFALVLSTTLLPTRYMSAGLLYCHLSHAAGILICLYTVVKARSNGRLGSSWILAGSSIFVVFSLWDIFISIGTGVSTTYLIHWGFLAFIVSQSAAIAQAYNDTFLKLIATEQDKNHSFEQLAKVFFPHQIAAIKQKKQLEETMPTHSDQACVLSFDIIESSKIKHIKAKEFFRRVFVRCNSIMFEGYDGHNLRAKAYRIKEIGDGFLCSIGYPFQSMTDNPANDAVDLARRFIAILHEEAADLHTEVPIACGVGIALDTLTGFYPETGTKEYDIYGRAIVLATRYEGMRKVLFEKDKRRSVLIIQDFVYQSLDPAHRLGFQVLELKDKGIVVRDDPAATRLYYQFIERGLEKEINSSLSSHTSSSLYR